jgi:hypothetical protein
MADFRAPSRDSTRKGNTHDEAAVAGKDLASTRSRPLWVPHVPQRRSMSYTRAERDVLVAGLVGGQERDAVWSVRPDAIGSLGDRGLVRIGQEVLSDGTISSFPLCLSPMGVLEARRLQEVDRVIWGEIAEFAGFGTA